MKTIHRILTPLIMLCIYPASIFLPMFRVMVASGLAKGETKTNILSMIGLGEYISLKDIYALAKKGQDSTILSTLKSVWGSMNEEGRQKLLSSLPDTRWLICCAVFFVLTLLVGLALIVCAAAVKRTAVSIILSAVGILTALFMNFSFNAFAKPLLSGAFSLGDILGSSGGILSALLGNLASVDYMKLSMAYSAVLLCFIAALIVGISAWFEQKNEA